jgi:hypothetical protein
VVGHGEGGEGGPERIVWHGSHHCDSAGSEDKFGIGMEMSNLSGESGQSR